MFTIALVFSAFLPDIYVWLTLLRHTPWWLQVAWWLPTTAIVAMFLIMRVPGSPSWLFMAAVTMALWVTLPKLAFMLPSIVGWALRWIAPSAWRVSNIVGCVMALAAFAIVAYGTTWGWRRLEVREVTMRVSGLPRAFEGYRIVQVGDLHVGTYNRSPQTVADIVAAVNRERPDLICFTGDLVNALPSELRPFTSELRKLRAKDGIVSVLGNHDYCRYAHDFSETEQARACLAVQREERALGWRLLMNEHFFLTRGTDTLTIVGVENKSKPPFPDRGDLGKAMLGAPQGCRILLTHDPTHWDSEVVPTSDIALTLSGHTHDGQFRAFGWSPAALVYHQPWGVFAKGLQRISVTRGAGSNVAFRFGAWPEIVVLTLVRG